MKVVVAGGGTAGHVNPAISLARAMEEDEVVFIGTSSGAEASLVPNAGFALETIEVKGFDRSKPLSLVTVGPKAIGAIVAARRIIKRHQPAAVVGMGGYVSLPACYAAATAGIPVVLHEQNIVLGLAHRACKRLARRIGVSFEATLEETGDKGVFTGNPISPEIAAGSTAALADEARRSFELDTERKTLLVFGGSLGARRVNEAAIDLAGRWKERSDRQIVHILGRAQGDMPEVESGTLLYRRFGFVERMILAYAVADLALCRGGATTLAELAAVGLPAIIVPYPYHRDRQQELQARVFEEAGAAIVIEDASTTGERVAAVADELLNDPGRLESMAVAAKTLGKPDASAALATVVREASR